MYVKREVDPRIILHFSWRTLLFSGALSSLVYFGFHYLDLKQFEIPFLPVATIGTAVAFYVGFKNNSSYDRLWEARKVWGELTNVSRSLASCLVAICWNKNAAAVKRIVMRQIAYVNILSIQLRRPNDWDRSPAYAQLSRIRGMQRSYEEQFTAISEKYCSIEEREQLKNVGNVAKQLVLLQMEDLVSLSDALDSNQLTLLLQMCSNMLASQGAVERTKTFPFPRQYAYFSSVFVKIFMVLLPFGLVEEFYKLEDYSWLIIPFSMLISWIFMTMEQVGDTSENPFEGGINDVPTSAICRSIEIDLLEILRESEKPLALTSVDHVLM